MIHKPFIVVSKNKTKQSTQHTPPINNKQKVKINAALMDEKQKYN